MPSIAGLLPLQQQQALVHFVLFFPESTACEWMVGWECVQSL
jgi:hypothetical protein